MSNKTTRISSEELSAFAAQGIQRAQEAREAAGVELSQEQLDQISGGANIAFNQGIIAGGFRFNQIQAINQAAINPIAIQGATLKG